MAWGRQRNEKKHEDETNVRTSATRCRASLLHPAWCQYAGRAHRSSVQPCQEVQIERTARAAIVRPDDNTCGKRRELRRPKKAAQPPGPPRASG